jgi:2,3-bisphosphoglycerate-independent phosphoglycerate mutase
LSVTTVMGLTVPESLCFEEDLNENRAVVEDIIRAGIKNRGYKGPQIDPLAAANHLFGLSLDFPLVLFESFQTARVGHSKNTAQTLDVLRICDIFLAQLLKRLKRTRTLLIVTSDHGNLEDMSVSGHTTNPVPLIAYGPGEEEFRRGMQDLTDIMPRILRTMC